jgi:hypothetical protein
MWGSSALRTLTLATNDLVSRGMVVSVRRNRNDLNLRVANNQPGEWATEKQQRKLTPEVSQTCSRDRV